jgi:hypothetical protein
LLSSDGRIIALIEPKEVYELFNLTVERFTVVAETIGATVGASQFMLFE